MGLNCRSISLLNYEDIDVPTLIPFSPCCCCEFPFSKSKPSSLSSPKLTRPLPILPLPTLKAHLQRATRSLISADSAAVSDVMSSCIKNDDAIAKLARDPKTISNGLEYIKVILTAVPECIQSASSQVLHEFDYFFSTLFSSSPHCETTSDYTVVFFFNSGEIL